MVGHPSVLARAITGDSVAISVRGAGTFEGAIDEPMARTRLLAGDQKPIVYSVTTLDKGFKPSAVALRPSAKKQLPGEVAQAGATWTIPVGFHP